MTEEQASAEGQNIRVLAAIGDAYRSIFQNFYRLVALSWWLALLILAAALVSGALIDLTGQPMAISLFYVVAAISCAEVAIRWHRHILLRETAYQGRISRVLTYLGAMLALMVVMFGPVGALVALGMAWRLSLFFHLLGILAFVISAYLAMRIGLALPIIALEMPRPFSTGWHLTTGASIRFAIGGFAANLPLVLLDRLVSIVGAPGPTDIPKVLVSIVIMVLQAAVTAGYLSHIYRQAVGEPASTDVQPVSPIEDSAPIG